ncbi:glycosyltransferase [Nostocoides veronense]|uniref:Glycosyltransferase n=1 Tax=Nostocoides veronense TaxID=330836 RepID=A0ABP4XRF3_9MICO
MTTGPEPATPAPITAALLVARIDDLMVDAVTALADQSRAPDGILLLDATAAGELPQRMAESAQFTAQLPNLSIERVATDCSVHDALRTAMAVDSGPGAVWLLSGDSVPAQDALEQLAGALEHDPTAALAAPKLLDVDRPGRLRRFGIQTTRSGRLQLGPRVGVPDQQQYDDRMDALAAPALGALFDREAYADLGGPLRSFGALGNDLDYGWRAQLAGHRVLLVPRARISVRANQIGRPTGADRRDARRVALARRPLLLTPFLALWIALSSLAVALGLLLLKRPAAAGRTAADLAALADPWRPIAARWRTRKHRRRQARTLSGLFVTREQSRAHASDRLHDVLVPRRRETRSAAAIPSQPTADHGSLIASPAIWGTVAVVGLLLAGSRTLGATLGTGLASGIHGGELRPMRADSTALWHAWWDGWAGAGLGSGAPASPALPGLAVLSWIAQVLPGDQGGSPAGRVIAALVFAALPLAFLTAYLGGRVVTLRRWPRAAVAGAWALSPVATASLASGRLGALAVLVLLPLVLASIVSMTRRSARPGSLSLAALLTMSLAAVVPGVLVVGVVLALALVLAGTGVARRRALGYLAVLALAAVPILLLLRVSPASLLGGWGMLADTASPPAWQIVLGQPDARPADGATLGTVTDYRTWLGAGILLAGLLGLARPRRRSGLATGAGLLAILGLAYAVAAPTLHLGSDSAGRVITAWAGAGLLLMTAGLLGAALVTAEGDLPATPAAAAPAGESDASPTRSRQTTSWRIAGIAVTTLVALAGAAQLAYAGLGQRLSPAADPRPAVAIDQAEGPAATRTLVLAARGENTTYDLIGREPGLPARDLPAGAIDGRLDAAVATLIDPGQASADPVGELAAWAVGFIVAVPDVDAGVLRVLDSSAGLTRIGDYAESSVWRVEPTGPDGRQQPARVRLAGENDWGTPVPVSGQHSATRAALAGEGTTLLVAESDAWAGAARVSVDGTRLTASPGPLGQQAYAVPAGAKDVRIIVTPHHRYLGWAYLVTLLVLVYLATPLGAPPRRRGGRHTEEAS